MRDTAKSMGKKAMRLQLAIESLNREILRREEAPRSSLTKKAIRVTIAAERLFVALAEQTEGE